jgi:hypothetical protein
MPDFPIDPELRIRASPPIVLRRTTEAVDFIRKVAQSTPDRAWKDLLQSFEAARDEWSAMEAVVHLELLLEAEGLLIEEGTAYAARSGQGRSRAAWTETCAMPNVPSDSLCAVAACKAQWDFKT